MSTERQLAHQVRSIRAEEEVCCLDSVRAYFYIRGVIVVLCQCHHQVPGPGWKVQSFQLNTETVRDCGAIGRVLSKLNCAAKGSPMSRLSDSASRSAHVLSDVIEVHLLLYIGPPTTVEVALEVKISGSCTDLRSREYSMHLSVDLSKTQHAPHCTAL